MSLRANAPVAVSLRPHPRAVEGDRGEVSRGEHADRGPPGRSIRSGSRRPSRLGDRPVQPSLRLLHARGRHDLSAPRGTAQLRRDRSGRRGCRVARGHVASPDRRRAARSQGPRLARRTTLASSAFDDLSLTTNGMLLTPLASSLASAGLTRVNISCDSLRADRFESIRRRGDLTTVLSSMDAAEAAGLTPAQGERGHLARSQRRRDPRLRRRLLATRAASCASLSSCRSTPRVSGTRANSCRAARSSIRCRRSGPSRRWSPADPRPPSGSAFVDGHGEIGLISSVTQPFCGTCNRLRLTSDGALRNCLFSDDELSVRDLIRDGAGDETDRHSCCDGPSGRSFPDTRSTSRTSFDPRARCP